MKNLKVISRDGIMCKIDEQGSLNLTSHSTVAKAIDHFKSVSITERFDGKEYFLCLSVADVDLNKRFVLSPNREQILMTIGKLLEYVNSEHCHLTLS